MAWHELPKSWRPDVGVNESGDKIWTEYHVEVEYITHHPDLNYQYYLRTDQWFTLRKEVDEYLEKFKQGKIRQAWIDKVVTIKTREKYYDFPHNIEPDYRAD